MGTKLNTGSGGSSVLVGVHGKEGEYFIGTLLAHKSPPSPYKDDKGNLRNYEVYEFTVEDTNMKTEVKVGKEYKDSPVKPGDPVSIFAPTRLNNALRQAEIGSKIKIVYLGLGKATKFGGKPHQYDVELI